jgi:transposase-like protein
MDSPLARPSEEEAYSELVEILHCCRLLCPRCEGRDHRVHRKHRAPVIDYQCRTCKCFFNAFTGTPLQKTSRPPSALLLIIKGIMYGTSTAQLARELGCNRMKLLALRHKIWDYYPKLRPLVETDIDDLLYIDADGCLSLWPQPESAASRRG